MKKEKPPELPKHDVERALKVKEFEEKYEPKYRKSGSTGSCLAFILLFAIATAVVVYVVMHREQFAQMFKSQPKPDAGEVRPDNGY